MTNDEALREFLEDKRILQTIANEAIGRGIVKIFERDDGTGQPEETVLLVGSRATIKGSKQVRCECGSICWLSPKGQQFIADRGGNVRLLCSQCPVLNPGEK